MDFVFKIITKDDYQVLTRFFSANEDAGFFDPFPLNEESARKITSFSNKDLYFGAFDGNEMVGFGMIRWYEDYKCPTLGLIVDKQYRGRGLGTRIYSFLFEKAREKGCQEVAAIVHKDNMASMRIAQKLGMVEIDYDHPYSDGKYDFTDYIKLNKQKVVLIKIL